MKTCLRPPFLFRVAGGLSHYALRDESGEYVMLLGIGW